MQYTLDLSKYRKYFKFLGILNFIDRILTIN
jgi:hypothetical protein